MLRSVWLCVLFLLPMGVSGCVRLTLAWADLEPSRPPAQPPILQGADGQIESAAAWKAHRPEVLQALEDNVYGTLPDSGTLRLAERRLIAGDWLDGRASLEEWTIEVQPQFDDVPGPVRQLRLGVMVPKRSPGPHPVILMLTFCENHNTFPGGIAPPVEGGVCDGSSMMTGAIEYVFGRYISTPPLQEIADAGYAIVAFHPGDFVPDAAGPGLEALSVLSAGHADDETRWGAVGAWGWLAAQLVELIDSDNRFSQDATIVWGHSRYGKAALVAAAIEPRIDGVIAHQSGAGSGSLSRNKLGETVSAITSDYPHWFSKRFAEWGGKEDAMPVDQHFLLALSAPRPVFLGNARRDVWSDPAGSFLAAQGADPVWQLYGREGLDQPDLRAFHPEADIAFWIRPGTHGITEEDWPAFLEFLQAHFAPPGAVAASTGLAQR